MSIRISRLIFVLHFLLVLGRTETSNHTFITFLETFLDYKNLSSVTMFMCLRKDFLPLVKYLSSSGKRSNVYSPEETYNYLSRLLSTEYYSLAVIVDLRCTKTTHLLKQASKLRLFSRLQHWLLISQENSSLDEWNLFVPLDSNVILVHQEFEHFYVQDVYKIQDMPIVFTPPRLWSDGLIFPVGPVRDDLHGLALRAGIVVLEDAWENRFDMRRKHLNTWSKLSYSLMTYVSEMLNFRMLESHVDSWGYPDENGSFSGLVGLLQRGEGDIGAVGCIISIPRMNAVQYTAETTPFRPRFIFREPPLSSVSNIYTMPFSVSVWCIYSGAMLLLTTALFVAQRTEKSMRDRWTTGQHSGEWSEALLITLGIVCQQGCSRTPDGFSSRTLFFVLFLLSLFFFTSYSAIIVSLLQSPSSAINTLAELIESPLKIVFDDIVYNYKYDNYVSENASALIWKLFHKDVLKRAHDEAFLHQEHGVELMRQGMVAFHVDMSAYKIIADTWHEVEKCDLKEVFMFPAYVFAIPVQTGSPYREMITLKLRWLREAGYIQREWKRWATERPLCEKNTGFISVGLQDFRPALLLLIYGTLTSLTILLLELGGHYAARRHRRSTPPARLPPCSSASRLRHSDLTHHPLAGAGWPLRR